MPATETPVPDAPASSQRADTPEAAGADMPDPAGADTPEPANADAVEPAGAGGPQVKVVPEARWALPDAWWRHGLLYQVYPRSFADADGDGIGDLRGVTQKLDYLEWLGVDAIWLSPITASPDADWGYDVSDYESVHAELGDLEAAQELIDQAAKRNIKVLLDLVPNHTSDRHPWFVEARTSRNSRYRDWYVWADPAPDGGPPNNWLSIFGGAAWTLDEETGQYYLHNFLPEQPDLNWWNEEVREEFERIIAFWLDRGVAGFRIDVCHGLVKDRELRDNPAPSEAREGLRDGGVFEDVEGAMPSEQERVYSMNRPEVHDILRSWRRLTDSYSGEDRVLVGETWAPDLDALAGYYGNGTDELHLAFNFHFTMAKMEAPVLAGHVQRTLASLPEEAWPIWTLSNHDISRFPTRWCDNDEHKVRLALLMLLSLPGTPVLYYGDELGMQDVDIPQERLLDPAGMRTGAARGRDKVRTPMPWQDSADAGFTTAKEPWLPVGPTRNNVQDQRREPGSILRFTRDMVALRRQLVDLKRGAYDEVQVTDAVWAWRRGDCTIVACNMSDQRTHVRLPTSGKVAICTTRSRDAEHVGADLWLGPWEAMVVTVDRPLRP